ncbi:hypothetical protein BDW66DRAFT_115067 [Aspergillus desertorum]
MPRVSGLTVYQFFFGYFIVYSESRVTNLPSTTHPTIILSRFSTLLYLALRTNLYPHVYSHPFYLDRLIFSVHSYLQFTSDYTAYGCHASGSPALLFHFGSGCFTFLSHPCCSAAEAPRRQMHGKFHARQEKRFSVFQSKRNLQMYG